MYTYTRDYRVPLSRTTRDLPFKAMISNLNCPITRFDFSVSLSLSRFRVFRIPISLCFLSHFFASFVSPSPRILLVRLNQVNTMASKKFYLKLKFVPSND